MIRTLIHIATLSFVAPSPWAETALQKNNPSVEFVDQSPVLFTVYFQRFPVKEGLDQRCASAIQALSGATPVTPYANGPLGAPWSPFTEDEQELLQECEAQPCKVKLSGAEVEDLQHKVPADRMARYQELIQARVQAYLASRERKSYEYVGGIRDPWAEWIERKWLNEGDVTGAPVLSLRKLDFLSSQARAIRQVLDVRKSQSARTFLFFNRDLYTDHYFDSWGEGMKLVCRPGAGDITFEAMQWVEFDLLKSTDFLSRISRPKMRQTIQEQQRKQIDQWVALVKKAVQ